ncbi:MAG: N-acetylneuraminate synthase family protein [Promethearchaeota archaeon]
MNSVRIGDKRIGPGHPCYIIGEIGINHNGDLSVAKKMIDIAAAAGCDAVKFQKRTPELCVPESQRNLMRETPWGIMTYMEYRERIEFGHEEFQEIDRYVKEKGIHWFASAWDIPSVEFLENYQPVCYKIASASLTDDALLKRIAETGRPVMLSTGMSTMDQIAHAVEQLATDQLLVAHSTSTYPCNPKELNLRMIQTLQKLYPFPVGYSGHEVGLQTTYAAVALGAAFVERHITLDRAMWGSDQAASVEPAGLIRLVRDIRIIEQAMGDGVKVVYDSELPAMKRLRPC